MIGVIEVREAGRAEYKKYDKALLGEWKDMEDWDGKNKIFHYGIGSRISGTDS